MRQTLKKYGCSRCNCEWDLPTFGNRQQEEDGDVLAQDEAQHRTPGGSARNVQQGIEIEEDTNLYESVQEIVPHDNSYEDVDSPTRSGRSFDSSSRNKRSRSLQKMGHGSFTAYATNGKVKASSDHLKIYSDAHAHTNGAAEKINEGVPGDQALDQSSNLENAGRPKLVHRCTSISGLLDSDHESSSDLTNASSSDLTNETVIPEDKTGMTEYFDEFEQKQKDEVDTNQEAEKQAEPENQDQEPNSISCSKEENNMHSETAKQYQNKEKALPQKFRIIAENDRNCEEESDDSETFVDAPEYFTEESKV